MTGKFFADDLLQAIQDIITKQDGSNYYSGRVPDSTMDFQVGEAIDRLAKLATLDEKERK